MQYQVNHCDLSTCVHFFQPRIHSFQPLYLLFSWQGVMKKCEGEEIFLGQFIYNKMEATIQTFELQVFIRWEMLSYVWFHH